MIVCNLNVNSLLAYNTVESVLMQGRSPTQQASQPMHYTRQGFQPCCEAGIREQPFLITL